MEYLTVIFVQHPATPSSLVYYQDYIVMIEKTYHSIICGSLNVYGISQKLNNHDNCLLQPIVNKYDLFSAVETWHTVQTNLHIEGYSHFSKAAVKRKRKVEVLVV